MNIDPRTVSKKITETKETNVTSEKKLVIVIDEEDN